VPNGIKAGDQSVTGKENREAIMLLANAQYDLERKMETFEEGSVNVTYYATAVGECSSYTSLLENLLDDNETSHRPPLPGAQPPGWVGLPDAQIIHLETLATDHHYPGALPPGWVALSARAYHTPAKQAPNMPRPRLRTRFSFFGFFG
jgi:hypothetical protein